MVNFLDSKANRFNIKDINLFPRLIITNNKKNYFKKKNGCNSIKLDLQK